MCEEGSQAPRHTVRTTVQFCLWMWVSPGYTIEMCTRLTYPVRKSCVTSNRTMDLLQKHNCLGKLVHARDLRPPLEGFPTLLTTCFPEQSSSIKMALQVVSQNRAQPSLSAPLILWATSSHSPLNSRITALARTPENEGGYCEACGFP